MTRRPLRSSSAATRLARLTVLPPPRSTLVPSRKAQAWRSKVSGGRTGLTAARATTRSPAGSRAPGPLTRRSGTTDSSTTSTTTTMSWERARLAQSSMLPRRMPLAYCPARPMLIIRRSGRPMMLTTDLSLKTDPIYASITKRFHEHPDQLADAFGKAWYKLLHRDMGPVSRYLGPWVPPPQIWQDPIPAADHELIGEKDISDLKGKLLASGLSISQLVSTAWAAAASFRGTDKRGGANGARIRLTPQKDWEVNSPPELSKVLQTLEKIQQDFNRSQSGGKEVSLADLIVLGGCAAVEQAAKNAGYNLTVSFAPGRTDASQEQTDVESFGAIEPTFDGFRNYLQAGEELSPETLLVERAFMLNLTAPEMTVLVGGMRALDANTGQSKHGVFTKRPGTLTNDFFVNLLDMSTEWK